MPIYGIDQGCKCPIIIPKATDIDEDTDNKKDCDRQCIGKVPMVEHWPDKEFTEHDFPNGCNLAMIMGKQLDGRWLVGFDIDGTLDLKEWLILPETLECKTGRGYHLVYEVPEDTPFGNWNDMFNTRSDTGYRLNYTGALDIKYCRGAMVSPPSINKNNIQYVWKTWMKPTILPHEEIIYLIRKRKALKPHIKRYKKWTLNPSHFGKQP